jgi:hypothetical protein
MGFQPYDFEKDWESLEPEEQPAGRRGCLWGAGFIAIMATICLVGAFVLVQRFRERTAVDGNPLAVPTSPVQEEEVATDESTNLNLAPTVTSVSNEELGEPPLGAGNVDVARSGEALRIDGDLGDWPDTPTTTSAFRVYSADGWDGSADLTAVWRLAWDPDNLYIGIEVTDDRHVQTQVGNQIFRGDSVDIQLDTDRAADYAPRLSPDDFQITFSPGNFSDIPPSAFLFRGTSDNQILDAPGQHSISVAARAVAEGYVLEAAVPWRDLEKVPDRDLILGAALNASDNDTPGTAVQEVMMSHVTTRTLRDPTGWGTLTLK